MKVSKITILEGKVFLFVTNECSEAYKDSFKEWVRDYLDKKYSHPSLFLYLNSEATVTSVLAILNANEDSSCEELDTTSQC